MATLPDMSTEGELEPPRIRFLRRLVYVLTGLLLVAAIVAVVGIVVKLATWETTVAESDAAPFVTTVPLSPGESLGDVRVERGQIYFRIEVENSDAARMIVIRASDGARIGEVRLAPTP